MSTTLTIECPACATAFPVDPDKVPAGGARTECTVCHTPFRVDDPAGEVGHEAAPEAWEDAGGDADTGSIEAVVTVEDVVVDEVVTVWDAEVPSEGDEEDDVSGDVEGWGTSVEDVEPGTAEPEDVGAAFEDESDTLAEMETTADEALSEMSEAMDGLVQGEDAASVEDDPSPLADGIVTDQWSELVSEGTEDAGEVADADAWGGGGDDEEWVLETEDEEMTLSDLDLDVERLDTVEDQVRAARDEPGLAESPAADFASDAEFVTGAGEDLLGGDEMVLPEDALEVEGGIAELGGEGEEEEASAEEPGSAGSDEAMVEEQEEEVVFQFGRRDPHDKARRLARVLVSDMITYNPERHEEALAQNRLKEDFAEEIDKSWAEYVEQVGPEIAESTDYWRDALNDILARGEPLF